MVPADGDEDSELNSVFISLNSILREGHRVLVPADAAPDGVALPLGLRLREQLLHQLSLYKMIQLVIVADDSCTVIVFGEELFVFVCSFYKKAGLLKPFL